MIALVILLISGFWGGMTAILLDNFMGLTTEKIHKFNLLKQICISGIIGMTAALTVPVFLNMIGSSMVEKLGDLELFSEQFYQLIGFTLIASMSAQRFIDNIRDKLFAEVEDNRNMINNMQQNIDNAYLMTLFESKLIPLKAHIESERYESALAEIKDLKNYYKDNENNKYLITLLKYEGYILKRLKKYEKAIEVLKETLELDPDEPNSLFNLACYMALNKNPVGEVINILTKIKKLNNEHARTALSRIKEDEDFSNIRDTKEFREFIDFL